MRKNPNEKHKKSQNRPNSSFGSINLEPPQIYREGQINPYASDGRGKKGSSKAKDTSSIHYSTSEMRSRQNKKRKLKNSARKAIISALFILVLAAAGIVLSLTVFFKTETITVSSSGIYSEQEIINVCSIDLGDNLFLIDKKGCISKLKNTLPYIYTAQIKIELPSTVKIAVTDAKPAFSIVNKDESYILLDDNFKVLENSSPQNPSGAVMINDAKVLHADEGYEISFENAQVSDCIFMLADGIKSVGMSEATAIISNGINENYIVYEGRIKFQLGSCDDLENKLYRGLAFCEEINKSNDKAKGTLNLTTGKQSYFTEEFS